jgi:phosphonate transport system permease protein
LGPSSKSAVLIQKESLKRISFWGIALFRWDINVRESAVLGLVGAGGLGMALDTAINLFQWDRVALILATIFAVVIVAEIVVTEVRKRII